MIELHFLPYGRVDAILIGVDGHWAFVDGGYRKDGRKAVKYMLKRGITRLDAYIATHRHRNHVGAAPFILSRLLSVGNVYTADKRMKERIYGLCTDEVESDSVNKTAFKVLDIGDTFTVGEATFTCIGPKKLHQCAAGAYKENQNSLILRVEYKGQTALLTGDTTAGVLSACADNDLRVDLLKNPHHNGALGEKILKRIAPKIAVVCNTKPPAKYYRQRLKNAGAHLYTAGEKGNGTVIAQGRGDGRWTVLLK